MLTNAKSSAANANQALDVRSALKGAMTRLHAAAVPSRTLAAELLLMHTLGCDRAWLYAHPEAPLTEAQAAAFAGLVARRADGVPTQYLTGKQEFWGLEFAVAPGVLIPRPETEHLIEVALALLGPPREGESFAVADVGTGSGCMAIALATSLPAAQVYATDISAAALAIARGNAVRHGVDRRVHFFECSLLEIPLAAVPIPALFDLIVSNPPYIGRGEAAGLPREVREHEPPEALFPGFTGDELYPSLFSQAGKRLRTGGYLVVELGYNQVSRIFPLLDSQPGWRDVQVTNDLAGIPRVLAARKGS
jgi:release factor glutamine methyltransferase